MGQNGIERRLREERLEDGVLFPAYEDYCVANVPETALAMLSSGFDRALPDRVLEDVATAVDHVVLVVVDGFGYEVWQRAYRDHAFLSRLTIRGTVTPLTSVYPSETASALTTLYTGRDPIEHGLLGWYQYLESVGRDVVTLPFTTLSGEALVDVAPDADANELFAGTSLYERARAAGIDVWTIQPADYVGSGYTRAATAGAERAGYDGASEFARSIRRTLEAAAGPTLVHAYEPTLDELAHAGGTDTRRYRTALGEIADALERELLQELAPAVAERTVLIVTADHGIVDTVPEENVDPTAWDDWDRLQETFRRDADGEPRLPTGSPRNVHVHVRPDRLADAREILERNLDGLVFDRREALERDLFGLGSRSGLFDQRCGDLIAVHRNRGVCWRAGDRKLVGMHGGLTPAEMLVPFATARLDTLRG
ncbi:alkaline phosphatase family protein [Natrialbaceae archaeon AArc-T1-2]|uniref:alkaline phosphatase family protein n=1 Tax=Natrialbaceae archaeon AArc-T1-2 TaxID=3053904 RepID=UPI00255AAF70|nr:alkaline phosphatase family protein [Natrialbaceae archaeon AArc-T1-2]WIV66262.1 alkaline phosphatase family protein [Natrialbaceae archaeon AArc-T1-2]